jgi:hypothetical protein
VRMSPHGMQAASRPVIWSIRWDGNFQWKLNYLEKTCLSTTSSTMHPTLPDLGSNPGRRGGKVVASCLSYCMT